MKKAIRISNGNRRYLSADVPFWDLPGSKIRPVVVVAVEAIVSIAVISSTSTFKPNLNLLHTVDFNDLRYFRVRKAGLRGVSYFYKQNLKNLESSRLIRFIGKMNKRDMDTILAALKK